ncbi:MAG TPA: holo-ACP synthase [bacterium (Candidatus Stahlbacteria)]|nr:holo-ACP synthase [Candidatus Stahlbacteria bacterium]
MVRVGVDIIEIARIRRSYERFHNRFLNRIFTEGEIEYAFEFKDPFAHLAVRFAAKEAMFKATGKLIPYSDIEVIDHPPTIRINGRVKEDISISLSHSQNQAIAIVLWEDSGS